MVLKLPEHSHCLSCGDPIPFGDEYCDDACRSAHVSDTKKTSIRDFFFYAGVAVILVAIVYTFIL